MAKILLIIGSGGFIGAIFRFITSNLINKYVPQFPFLGTLTVNVIGSFLFGYFLGLGGKNETISDQWLKFLLVGFCGSYTTFSTFSWENINLLQQNQVFTMIAYASVSFVAGLLAVYGGLAISRMV
jgi:CrcB protein